MKIKNILLSFALIVVFHVFTQAQKVKTEKEVVSGNEISNSDSLKGTNMLPSEKIYGNLWDTLYIRLSRNAKVSVNDSVILKLLTEENSNVYMLVPGKVISEFGWRHGRIHAGIDIQLNKGDSIHSAFDGVVRISRYFSGYGNIVVVRHYNGLETCYAHMSKRLTKVSQIVKAGDVLGLGGRTGHATCNHLHFEVRYLQEPINPRLVVNFENQKINSDTLIVSNDTFFHRKNISKKHTTNKSDLTIDKKGNYYYIKQGDTLYSLAKRYNTSVTLLCNKNNISEKSTLRIGQKLKL